MCFIRKRRADFHVTKSTGLKFQLQKRLLARDWHRQQHLLACFETAPVFLADHNKHVHLQNCALAH